VFTLAPDRELHFVGAVAEPVVVDPVLERLRLLGDVLHDELPHRVICAVEQRLARREVGVLAEAVADLHHAPLGRAAARDDAHEVGAVHLGHAHVVEDELDDLIVGLAFVVDLDGGDADTLAEDRLRPRRQRARQRAAGVHLMAEHAGPAYELAAVEDRRQHQPVVDMRDRAATQVGVAGEDHVALADRPFVAVHHLSDVGAELAHDHAAARVGDHGKLVVLLPDNRAHGGAEEHRVHLVTRILERALDDVEGDGVDLDRRDLRDCDAFHTIYPPN